MGLVKILLLLCFYIYGVKFCFTYKKKDTKDLIKDSTLLIIMCIALFS